MPNEIEIISMMESNLPFTYLADLYVLGEHYLWAPSILLAFVTLHREQQFAVNLLTKGIFKMNSYLNGAVNTDDKIPSFHACQ